MARTTKPKPDEAPTTPKVEASADAPVSTTPLSGETPATVTGASTLSLSAGFMAVLAERQRAIADKGRTAETDDIYTAGELLQAGICYASMAAGLSGIRARAAWPFPLNTFKPGDSTRDLIKATQLLLAELDRRHRAGDPLSQTVN